MSKQNANSSRSSKAGGHRRSQPQGLGMILPGKSGRSWAERWGVPENVQPVPRYSNASAQEKASSTYDVSPETWSTAKKLAREGGYSGTFEKLPAGLQRLLKEIAAEIVGQTPKKREWWEGAAPFLKDVREAHGLTEIPADVYRLAIQKAQKSGHMGPFEKLSPQLQRRFKVEAQQEYDRPKNWYDGAAGFMPETRKPSLVDPITYKAAVEIAKYRHPDHFGKGGLFETLPRYLQAAYKTQAQQWEIARDDQHLMFQRYGYDAQDAEGDREYYAQRTAIEAARARALMPKVAEAMYGRNLEDLTVNQVRNVQHEAWKALQSFTPAWKMRGNISELERTRLEAKLPKAQLFGGDWPTVDFRSYQLGVNRYLDKLYRERAAAGGVNIPPSSGSIPELAAGITDQLGQIVHGERPGWFYYQFGTPDGSMQSSQQEIVGLAQWGAPYLRVYAAAHMGGQVASGIRERGLSETLKELGTGVIDGVSFWKPGLTPTQRGIRLVQALTTILGAGILVGKGKGLVNQASVTNQLGQMMRELDPQLSPKEIRARVKEAYEALRVAANDESAPAGIREVAKALWDDMTEAGPKQELVAIKESTRPNPFKSGPLANTNLAKSVGALASETTSPSRVNPFAKAIAAAHANRRAEPPPGDVLSAQAQKPSPSAGASLLEREALAEVRPTKKSEWQFEDFFADERFDPGSPQYNEVADSDLFVVLARKDDRWRPGIGRELLARESREVRSSPSFPNRKAAHPLKQQQMPDQVRDRAMFTLRLLMDAPESKIHLIRALETKARRAKNAAPADLHNLGKEQLGDLITLLLERPEDAVERLRLGTHVLPPRTQSFVERILTLKLIMREARDDPAALLDSAARIYGLAEDDLLSVAELSHSLRMALLRPEEWRFANVGLKLRGFKKPQEAVEAAILVDPHLVVLAENLLKPSNSPTLETKRVSGIPGLGIRVSRGAETRDISIPAGSAGGTHAGKGFTGRIKQSVLGDRLHICPGCLRETADRVDHYYARNRGGTSESDNAWAMCSDCNGRKYNRLDLGSTPWYPHHDLINALLRDFHRKVNLVKE